MRSRTTRRLGTWTLFVIILSQYPLLADFGFTRVVVDPNGPAWTPDRGMHTKAAGDLNGDGLADLIVAGSATNTTLQWYSSPTWEKHLISTLGGWSTDAHVADIDRDGNMDLVISSWYRTDAGLEWFENTGAGVTWTHHFIGAPRAHDLSLADFDLDGDLDIVSREQLADGARLQLWRQDSPTAWSHRTLTTGIPVGEGLEVGDMDRDNDLDIVLGRIWLENSQDILAGPWPIHNYTSTWTHPHVVVATADLNLDGKLDVLLTPSESAGQTYRISWFEGPADPYSTWTEHVIEPAVEAVMHSLQLRDFDRDGDLDLLTAEMHQSANPDRVRLYYNDGVMNGAIIWADDVISNQGAHNVQAADFDGDGYDDFFGPNWSETQVVDLWLSELRLNAFDFNDDDEIDELDVAILLACGTGPSVPYDVSDLPAGCTVTPDASGHIPPDLDRDGDVDSIDFARLQRDLRLVDQSRRLDRDDRQK